MFPTQTSVKCCGIRVTGLGQRGQTQPEPVSLVPEQNVETLVSCQKDVMRVSELGPNSREWGDEMPVASFPVSVSVSLPFAVLGGQDSGIKPGGPISATGWICWGSWERFGNFRIFQPIVFGPCPQPTPPQHEDRKVLYCNDFIALLEQVGQTVLS